MPSKLDTSTLEEVGKIVEDFDNRLTGPRKDELARIAQRIREPLRIAVAGLVNSGKSTLVNALLRQTVAPTDVTECTRLVTWFQHGKRERVEVIPREGEAVSVPLERNGALRQLPRTLPLPVEEIAALHVYLNNDALRRMTVIDTPGLGSIEEEISAQTEQFLTMRRSSLEAAMTADVILFLVNRSIKTDDRRMLELWANAADPGNGAGLAGSAVNAIGVLTKADELGDGGDPWPVAVELALRQTDRIADQVATVVPVIGLLAETANTAALTERDVGYLERLVALEADEREEMLLSLGDFRDWEQSVPEGERLVPDEIRKHLIDRLGLYGLRRALEEVANGTSGALALNAAVERASGIDELERALDENFLGQRSDLLLASSALDALDELGYSETDDPAEADALSELRERVEAVLDDEGMHPLAELKALESVLTAEVELPPELVEDFKRVTAAGPLSQRQGVPSGIPADMRAAAIAGIERWRRFMFDEASPQQDRIARVAIESYTLALRSLDNE